MEPISKQMLRTLFLRAARLIEDEKNWTDNAELALVENSRHTTLSACETVLAKAAHVKPGVRGRFYQHLVSEIVNWYSPEYVVQQMLNSHGVSVAVIRRAAAELEGENS